MFEISGTNNTHRILIVDDDRELAQSLKEILLDEGFSVDTACNGREGVRLQNANPYNVIITDIVMPEEDGLEVIMWVNSHIGGWLLRLARLPANGQGAGC